MKLMIKEKNYDYRLNKLMNKFPILFLLVALVVITIYHVIVQLISDQTVQLFSPEVVANVFFQGTMAMAVVYFGKSFLLRNVFKVSPDQFAESEVLGYLPCINGSWIHENKAGFLVLEEQVLKLYVKKVDGFVAVKKWTDLSQVRIEKADEKFNISSILLFGLNESILITDGKTSQKILFPMVNETVDELNTFLKKYL